MSLEQERPSSVDIGEARSSIIEVTGTVDVLAEKRNPGADRRQADRAAQDVIGALPVRPVKDNWDKIAALAPIISGALIFAMGGVYTYAFNQQQLRLQEIQTIERFIPHLMGNEQSKKAAILAISSLTNTELAGKFASIFASSGTVSALQKIASTGSEKDKSAANKALNDAIDALATKEGQLSNVEDSYKQAIDQSSSQPGVNESDLAYNLFKLGELYAMKGQYPLAEAAFKRCLEIRQRLYGKDNAIVGETLKSLAELYKATGRADLAQATLKRAHATDVSKSAQDNAADVPTAPPRQIPSANEAAKDPSHATEAGESKAAGSAAQNSNAGEQQSRGQEPSSGTSSQLIMAKPAGGAAANSNSSN